MWDLSDRQSIRIVNDFTPVCLVFSKIEFINAISLMSFEATGDAVGSLTLDGKVYDMLQFHMHTGSEHYVQGVQSDLAIHFVHQADDGEYSVVGLMCDAGDVQDADLSAFWQSLENSIKNLGAEYTIDVNQIFNSLNMKKYHSV